MDLTAAYDAVWHTGLYYKVSKTTPHSFTRLVELLLRNSHFRVHMDDICFLLGSYVDWRKFRTSLHVKFTGKDQGDFLESSRSLRGKVVSYSVAGSEIPSLMASFPSSLNAGIFLP